MNDQMHLDESDDENVYVRIKIPWPELKVLHETLRLSRNRHKDPVRFIKDIALESAIGLASSTVNVSDWKHLEDFAGKLGVESPV
jgi:hypothetical protein